MKRYGERIYKPFDFHISSFFSVDSKSNRNYFFDVDVCAILFFLYSFILSFFFVFGKCIGMLNGMTNAMLLYLMGKMVLRYKNVYRIFVIIVVKH